MYFFLPAALTYQVKEQYSKVLLFNENNTNKKQTKCCLNDINIYIYKIYFYFLLFPQQSWKINQGSNKAKNLGGLAFIKITVLLRAYSFLLTIAITTSGYFKVYIMCLHLRAFLIFQVKQSSRARPRSLYSKNVPQKLLMTSVRAVDSSPTGSDSILVLSSRRGQLWSRMRCARHSKLIVGPPQSSIYFKIISTHRSDFHLYATEVNTY